LHGLGVIIMMHVPSRRVTVLERSDMHDTSGGFSTEG
jgi:hypothetical protein